jgi:hypothetical protein
VVDVKLGRLGKRTIFSKNKFIFDVIIPFSYIQSPSNEQKRKLMDTLAPTVGHELTHSYQTYKQLLGGKPTIGFGRETVLNMLPQRLKYGVTPSWNNFLHLVYLHLSFEVNARVTELYYKLKSSNVKNKQEALNVMSSSEPWNDYKLLKSFDAEEFINKFDAELHKEDDPLHDLIKRFMGHNPKTSPTAELPKSNEEWFKVLIDRWDQLIQDAQVRIKEIGIDIPFMERVPDRAKENPIEFFKFFEKRFHKKAENLRRKLTRVVSLVLQEAEEIQKAS